jgi:hypothetical protein
VVKTESKTKNLHRILVAKFIMKTQKEMTDKTTQRRLLPCEVEEDEAG